MGTLPGLCLGTWQATTKSPGGSKRQKGVLLGFLPPFWASRNKWLVPKQQSPTQGPVLQGGPSWPQPQVWLPRAACSPSWALWNTAHSTALGWLPCKSYQIAKRPSSKTSGHEIFSWSWINFISCFRMVQDVIASGKSSTGSLLHHE